jgi:hypothetical protein
VLEQDTCILFMDTDGVFDGLRIACSVDKVRVQVVDSTLAIAAKSQTVGHVSSAVLSEIKCMLALMGMLRISIGYDHLSKRHSVEDRSHVASVVETDVAQDDTLTIVESDMNGPILPLDGTSINIERNTLRLRDLDWLDVGPEADLLFDMFTMEVARRRLVKLSSHFRDVDVDDLLCVCIENRAEVQRIRVLAVIGMRAVIHQSLLETNVASKSLVVTDSPWIAVYFMHVLRWDTDDSTLLDDLGICTDNFLDGVQVLHGDLA